MVSERALERKVAIDSFLAKRSDLRHLELGPVEWKTIELVSTWLWLFRSATEEMSSSKNVTLSRVHKVFRSLQDHIKSLLSNLIDSAPPALRIGNAHTKLSDYYTYFDQSPYYIWSCREFAYS